MVIKYRYKTEPTDNEKPSEEASTTEPNAQPNNELGEEKPKKRVRRQATEEELNHPLHGVKLAQLLEHLVEHYGWEYLAERVNIRCFKYNPTMKSSLGFLRKIKWAREHVEDVYIELVEKDKSKLGNNRR